MNDSGSEYLNGNGSSNGNGNGSANNHEKIFDVQRKDDPILAKVAPAARKQCCRDKSMTKGARMFFSYLVDMSLTFGTYIRKGIVKLSDHDMGKELGVSSKTIRNWKTELAESGRIWITERWNKNSFPTTVYNVTALVGQPELPLEAESRNGDLVQHETFAASNRHPGRFLDRSSSGKFKCQAHGESNCPICRKRRGGRFELKPPEQAKTPESIANKGPEEKNLPCSTVKICRPQRQEIAAPHGKNLP